MARIGTATRAESKVTSRQQEFETKIKRIREVLNNTGLGGVALSSQALFAWVTGGGDNHVVLASEGGVGHLVITTEEVVLLANNIEINRLHSEEFAGIRELATWECPWHGHELLAKEIHRRMGGRRWASDSGLPGSERVCEPFVSLTYMLLPTEIERYRALGKDCSLAMEEALEEVRPGQTEHHIAGLIIQKLLDRGVRSHVILVAADERVDKHRHPIPTNKKLKNKLMAVLCGKRGGLIVALTRMLYFGKKLPEDLVRRHTAVCHVDLAFNASSRPGTPLREVFEAGRNEYEAQGFRWEWKLHHQGGPCGYQGRSYLGTPEEERPVLANQAFAWNPSITGTKSEDTILVGAKGFEFLSGPSKKWPTVTVKYGGSAYKRAAIKLR